MGLIDFLKGVFRRMISPSTIQQVLKVAPAVSPEMQQAIELWEKMYTGNSPWIDKNTKSLGIATMIASEKARMATLEMKVKMTGDSERAKYLQAPFNDVLSRVRNELESGIALGSFVIKPYVTMGVDGKYKIETTFANANNFYPLSFAANGDITEAAFIDRIVTKEFIYSKVERHNLVDNKLTVENFAFRKGANEYKDINVSVSPNDTKTRPVRLEALNLDGIRNPNFELVQSIMKQKENSFTEGTIIIFPHSIHPDTTGYTAVNFEIETYTHRCGAVFTSESIGMYIPEPDLITALSPIVRMGYKGYGLVLNLYKYKNKKDCRRLYMMYF